MAHLKLEHFNLAYQDALKVTQTEKSGEIDTAANEKAFFRMAKALYAMRQFQEAHDSFKKCIELNPSNSEAAVELEKCKQRISESQTGNYDMGNIIKLSREQKQLFLDVADFTSPDIEVVNLNNDANYKG